jgi:AhpD family alkylhydroperoxidase
MLEEPRMQLMELAPEAFRHLIAVERLIGEKVDPTLLHLVKMRASQVNGCALCLTMHTGEALAANERPERLTCLDGWRESPLYTDAERAALTWVEEITLISVHGASREAYEGVKAHFSEEEIAWLTLAATSINGMNRLAISSRARYERAAVEEVKQMMAAAG